MLKTEMRNPHTTHFDKMSSAEQVAAMCRENQNAVLAVEKAAPEITKAIDAVADAFNNGHRLFFVGAGTSGRLGVLDAAECPPTYGVPHGLVVGIIAGGDGAIRRAVEGAEDSYEAGKRDLAAHHITANDAVIGISVAGGASYVLGAFSAAGEVGALKIALTCNPGTPIEREAAIVIHPDTGEEVITGSTRMKAGSAHKMILNMISTAVMVKLGHVYENLMINLRPSNIKLRARIIGIVCDLTGADAERAERALADNDFDIRAALRALGKEA